MDVHYFREVKISTRFGEPSCALVCGRVGGVSVCMLARHGVGHTLLPADVNYAANIAAMKVFSVHVFCCRSSHIKSCIFAWLRE